VVELHTQATPMGNIKAVFPAILAGLGYEFTLVPGAKPGHQFRAPLSGRTFQFLIVTHSRRNKLIEVNLAAGYFPFWDGRYGSHQMRWATNLRSLASGDDQLGHEAYAYSGEISEALRSAASDFSSAGATACQRWHRKAQSDTVLKAGLDWLSSASLAPGLLSELESDLKNARYRIDRLKHPMVVELKAHLRKQAASIRADRHIRRETGVLAFDLLTLGAQAIST